jgi:hypothetical protein
VVQEGHSPRWAAKPEKQTTNKRPGLELSVLHHTLKNNIPVRSEPIKEFVINL